MSSPGAQECGPRGDPTGSGLDVEPRGSILPSRGAASHGARDRESNRQIHDVTNVWPAGHHIREMERTDIMESAMADTSRGRPRAWRSRPFCAALIAAALMGVGQAHAAKPAMGPPSGDMGRVLDALKPIPLAGEPGAPIGLPSGRQVPGVPAWPARVGSPPPFAVPRGGRVTAEAEPDLPGVTRVTLFRPNGNRYADATLVEDRGVYDSFRFYDSDDQVVFAQFSTLGELNTRGARQTAKGRSPKAGRSVDPSKGAGPSLAPSLRTRREMATCGAHFHNDAGYVLWGSYYPLYINLGTFPGTWINSILYGADNWNSHQDWCGIAEANIVQITYAGGTGALWGFNGINTVDRGPSQCGPSAIGCTAVYICSAPFPCEIDTRFTDTAPFMITGGAVSGSHYDLEGVATHEFGHAVGLAHVTSTGETMFSSAFLGDTSNRLLGRGDAEYINTKY